MMAANFRDRRKERRTMEGGETDTPTLSALTGSMESEQHKARKKRQAETVAHYENEIEKLETQIEALKQASLAGQNVEDELEQLRAERDLAIEGANQLRDLKNTGLLPVPSYKGALVYDPADVYLHPGLGLSIGVDLDRDLFFELCEILFSTEDAIQLAIGDLALMAEELGIPVEEIANQYNRNPDTIEEYMRVSKSADKSIRMETLTFSHYQVVSARRYDSKRKELLQDGAGMTIQEFTVHVRGGKEDPPTASDRYYAKYARFQHTALKDVGQADDRTKKTVVNGLRELADKIEATIKSRR